MKIVYTPESGDNREWAYKPQKMLSVDAEAIERVTGWTFQEFGEKFMAGSALAQHALLWVLLRRDNRALKFSDVRFAMDEMNVDFDAEERAAMREALDGPDAGDLSDDERIQLEKYLAESEDDDSAADPSKPASGAKTRSRKEATENSD